MKGSLKATAVAVLLSLVLGGCGASKKETIKVGSDMTYKPFEFIDEKTKKPSGFDIEYMEALGKAMGVKIEFVNTAWDGLIPGLQAGQYDLLISAMTITPERQKSIDFTNPYFTTGQVIAVKAGTTGITAPADLKGKVVSVQIGTTGQIEAEKIAGIKRIDKYPTMPEAFVALKQSKADASVVDELVALDEMKANPGGIQVVDKPFTTEVYGIGIKKDRADLLERVNKAIDKLKSDGTYDKIYEKWITAAK